MLIGVAPEREILGQMWTTGGDSNGAVPETGPVSPCVGDEESALAAIVEHPGKTLSGPDLLIARQLRRALGARHPKQPRIRFAAPRSRVDDPAALSEFAGDGPGGEGSGEDFAQTPLPRCAVEGRALCKGIEGGTIGLAHGVDVLGSFEPALDLDAAHPGSGQFRDVVEEVEIAQAQERPPATAVVEIEAAALLAGAAVGAAPGREGRHRALTAVCITERPVDKTLHLDPSPVGGLGAPFQLAEGEFSSENDPSNPEIGQNLDLLRRVDRHLGRCVDFEIRELTPDHPPQPEVLQNHRVRSGACDRRRRSRGRRQFEVAEQRVQGDVATQSVAVEVVDVVGEELEFEVLRPGPG